MKRDEFRYERLLSSGETALLFHVEVATVNRWARQGRLRTVRTLGGHRRFFEAEVRARLNRDAKEAQP